MGDDDLGFGGDDTSGFGGDWDGGYTQADADAQTDQLYEDAMREQITGPAVDPDDPRTGEEIAAERRSQAEDAQRAYDTLAQAGASPAEMALGAGDAPGEVWDAIDPQS